MKVLLDLNLSPTWVAFLTAHGIEAVHWSTVGDPRAKDETLMTWARDHGFVVFTHDLDFSALVATTAARGPSVIQVRTHDVLPVSIGPQIVQLLRDYEEPLTAGAIVSIDELAARVRILPIHRAQ